MQSEKWGVSREAAPRKPCLAAALRGLDAPGENLKLMPLARPSMPCFNECAIDPHYHSLGRFGDNTRMIDFLADLLFNAFADSERSVAFRWRR